MSTPTFFIVENVTTFTNTSGYTVDLNRWCIDQNEISYVHIVCHFGGGDDYYGVHSNSAGTGYWRHGDCLQRRAMRHLLAESVLQTSPHVVN